MLQGFFLGLSTGATCLAYCAPSLVPYLLGEGKTIKYNALTLFKFMIGRLLGYLLFAVLAWLIGYYIHVTEAITGLVYLLLALLLFGYGITSPAVPCSGHTLNSRMARVTQSYPAVLPFVMGLLTGLNLCPPFLMTFTSAITAATVWQSMQFFFFFFLGTSVYFVWLPLLGGVQKWPHLKTIGKMTAIVMSLYYIYTAIIMMIGGIHL
jgi:sulfite exporter TauE/SafE